MIFKPTALKHVQEVYIGKYRVAAFADEHLNPRRPSGGLIPAKAYTVDYYFPVPGDRVRKYKTQPEALSDLTAELRAFADKITYPNI
jgi:hypothetical protein